MLTVAVTGFEHARDIARAQPLALASRSPADNVHNPLPAEEKIV
jgi:hypothetical protein